MTHSKALDIVRAAFPRLRISDVDRIGFMFGNSVRLKKGKATIIIGLKGSMAMCAAEVSVGGVEYALNPYTHEGYEPSTFAARVDRLAKAIDALAAVRGAK